MFQCNQCLLVDCNLVQQYNLEYTFGFRITKGDLILSEGWGFVQILCNTPLVSIGIISVEGALESNVCETHYDEGIGIKHELIISVSTNTVMRKGILVFPLGEYISDIGSKYSLYVRLSLSKL